MLVIEKSAKSGALAGTPFGILLAAGVGTGEASVVMIRPVRVVNKNRLR